MNKKEHFFSTENRTITTGNTIKRKLNGIFFRIISLIASAETPVYGQFSEHFSKSKDQNMTGKQRNQSHRTILRTFIKIYFHFKVLFSQGIRADSCFRAEKKE